MSIFNPLILKSIVALLLLSLYGCSDSDPISDHQASLNLQLHKDRPSGDIVIETACSCSPAFIMGAEAEPPMYEAHGSDYDFSVKVKQTAACDPGWCWGDKCGMAQGKFSLTIDNLGSFGLDLNDFAAIGIRIGSEIVPPSGIYPAHSKITTDFEEGEVLFRWDDGLNGNVPDAAQLAFSGGGICIIDIVTDPVDTSGNPNPTVPDPQGK